MLYFKQLGISASLLSTLIIDQISRAFGDIRGDFSTGLSAPGVDNIADHDRACHG